MVLFLSKNAKIFIHKHYMNTLAVKINIKWKVVRYYGKKYPNKSQSISENYCYYINNSDYQSVLVYLVCTNNVNETYFDNIGLFKEEFRQSYTYDSYGNIISSKVEEGIENKIYAKTLFPQLDYDFLLLEIPTNSSNFQIKSFQLIALFEKEDAYSSAELYP